MPNNLQKIITVSQIQAADNYTIRNEPIASIELMERAANAFVSAIEPRLVDNQKIAIVCGKGNNGGDGLAVSRILQSKGISIAPFLIESSGSFSPDCKFNFNKLETIETIESISTIPDFTKFDIIIDAVFGSGLNRPIVGLAQEVIKNMNQSGKMIISIDVPSGIYCEALPDSECIVKSNLTISFQRPKLSFFFPEYDEYLKEWKIVDIGLSEDFIQAQETDNFVLDERITESVKTRGKFSHKGTFGHSLLIVGAHGKIGAAILASKACLRSGVGLLTTYVPKCGYEIIQTMVPEAMCETDENESFIKTLPDLSIYNAVGIGPGIGKNVSTKNVVKELFKNFKKPLVIDADALNIISEDEELLKLLPKNSILTPHPKEFERLAGKWTNSLERLQKQKQFSKDHQCIIVLKGANTCVSNTNGEGFFNTSGNSGMATGGSGDVLTGIITGLLAQNYTSLEAALIAVFFHGKAGDLAAINRGENGLIASDIIEHLRIESQKVNE